MIAATREQRRQLERDNAKIPRHLIPFDFDPALAPPGLVKVFRSRDFLVQVFAAPAPAVGRLSVSRTALNGDRWVDGVSWDDLQRLKREAGFAHEWAVEIFPPDSWVVNVANMRHVWLVAPGVVPFAWGAPEPICTAATPTPSQPVVTISAT